MLRLSLLCDYCYHGLNHCDRHHYYQSQFFIIISLLITIFHRHIIIINHNFRRPDITRYSALDAARAAVITILLLLLLITIFHRYIIINHSFWRPDIDATGARRGEGSRHHHCNYYRFIAHLLLRHRFDPRGGYHRQSQCVAAAFAIFLRYIIINHNFRYIIINHSNVQRLPAPPETHTHDPGSGRPQADDR